MAAGRPRRARTKNAGLQMWRQVGPDVQEQKTLVWVQSLQYHRRGRRHNRRCFAGCGRACDSRHLACCSLLRVGISGFLGALQIRLAERADVRHGRDRRDRSAQDFRHLLTGRPVTLRQRSVPAPNRGPTVAACQQGIVLLAPSHPSIVR